MGYKVISGTLTEFNGALQAVTQNDGLYGNWIVRQFSSCYHDDVMDVVYSAILQWGD